MKRLTNNDKIYRMDDVDEANAYDDHIEECLEKLSKLEDIEEDIGIDLTTLFSTLKEKEAYLCFVDDEWCVCDMQTDTILDLK